MWLLGDWVLKVALIIFFYFVISAAGGFWGP